MQMRSSLSKSRNMSKASRVLIPTGHATSTCSYQSVLSGRRMAAEGQPGLDWKRIEPSVETKR